jgi:PIN domain nuclease of toxin-antitoxin system
LNILVDTHIFLWALAEPEKLTDEHRESLETPVNRVLLSAVSITEIMIKASLGKLTVPFDPVEVAKQSGFELLPFDAKDALPLRDLPFHHRDPFDRMLIAQAIKRDYLLMTNDHAFWSYPVSLL